MTDTDSDMLLPMFDESEVRSGLDLEATKGWWVRYVEALVFASPTPVPDQDLRDQMPKEVDADDVFGTLVERYKDRGVHFQLNDDVWSFVIPTDIMDILTEEVEKPKKLPRVATEVLGIIAYHQPITKPEIERMRDGPLNHTILKMLVETGWVESKGKRRTRKNPDQWGTTEAFNEHFGLTSVEELPGMEELSTMGLVSARSAEATVLRDRVDESGESESETATEEMAVENAVEEET